MSSASASANEAKLQKWIETLVCPVCHQSLDALPEDAGSAASGSGQAPATWLRCRGCGRAYPIVDGIPAMLAKAAEPVADIQSRQG